MLRMRRSRHSPGMRAVLSCGAGVDLLSAVLEGAEPGDLTALEKEHVRIGEAWEAAEARVEEIRARLETRRGIQQSAREGESGQKRRCTIFRPAVTRPAPGLS